MGLLSNLLYILIGFIGLVVVFLIVLSLIEKRLYKTFLSKKYTRNHLYIEKLSKINVQKPEEGLQSLKHVVKNFFREAFHSPDGMELSEFEQYFSKRNNKKAIELSSKIVRFMYSGQTITQEQLQELVRLTAEIVSSNKILSKEERKDLDKKAMENQPWEKRSRIGKIVKRIKD